MAFQLVLAANILVFSTDLQLDTDAADNNTARTMIVVFILLNAFALVDEYQSSAPFDQRA